MYHSPTSDYLINKRTKPLVFTEINPEKKTKLLIFTEIQLARGRAVLRAGSAQSFHRLDFFFWHDDEEEAHGAISLDFCLAGMTKISGFSKLPSAPKNVNLGDSELPLILRVTFKRCCSAK